MSTLKFRFLLRDLGVVRFWSSWTHKYIFNSVVKRCMRDRGVREVIQRFRHTILRPKRTLLLSATAAYKSHNDDTFGCDQGISDDELLALRSDLENVQKLMKMTIYCTSCGKRLVIDRKQPDIRYCGCKEPKPEKETSDGWSPYMETDDIIIWRKEYKVGKGQYAYKVYGRYGEVLAHDFAAVQLDGAYRRAWDRAVATLALVQRAVRGVAGQDVLHWEVLWPRLFANRDYVYVRRHQEFDINELSRQETTKLPEKPTHESNVHAKAKRKSLESYARRGGADVPNKLYVIVSRSCEHPAVPETKDAIRVMEYWSHMVVKSLHGTDKPGMEFVLTYYDEPGTGGMPSGVAAWASSRAAPAYLTRMRRAAADYRAWAATRRTELPDFVPFGPEQLTHEPALQEQDMESSKQGPELENGSPTSDKAVQTDDYLINNDSVSKGAKGDEPKNGRTEENGNEVGGSGGKREDSSEEKDNVKTKELSEKQETIEGESEKPEEESNGGWWRYLYPFYYFV